MSIDQKYKMELLGMISAIGFAHEKELGTNLASLGTEAISKQQAIDAVNCVTVMKGIRSGKSVTAEAVDCAKRIIADNIRQLPPIQPEIIYCKDCKHFIREDVEEYTPYGYDTHFHAFCDKHWDEEQGEYIDVNLDDYCSFAERREVTT